MVVTYETQRDKAKHTINQAQSKTKSKLRTLKIRDITTNNSFFKLK